MSRMTGEDLTTVLGAYLDGELTAEERTEVEAMAASDPAVQAELDIIEALNLDLREGFSELLEEPVPPELIPAPVSAPVAAPQPAPSGFLRLVASFALLAIGAGAGAYATYTYAPPVVEQVAARGWMADIADYHVVYASQTRHLVEVPASEKDHIEAWLGKTTGVPFTVPDLGAAGYTFEGARLLVAAGKPVAQLLYTDADGAVIAICAIERQGDALDGFVPREFGDIHMVRWDRDNGAFVVVGPKEVDLLPLAEAASTAI